MNLSGPRPVVVRHLLLAVLVVAACALALVDSQPWSGPVLLTVSAHHGLHATDPLLLALAPACVALLYRSARHQSAVAAARTASYALAA